MDFRVATSRLQHHGAQLTIADNDQVDLLGPFLTFSCRYHSLDPMPAGETPKENRIVAGRDGEGTTLGVKNPVVDAICHNMTWYRRRLMTYPFRQSGRHGDQCARPAELHSVQRCDQPDHGRQPRVGDGNVAICAVDLLDNRDTT